MRVTLRERTMRGEDLKILATTEYRDVEMLRGYMKEHCKSLINPTALQQMFTQKWDRPRLYLTALGPVKSGVAGTRRATNGKPLRGFAVATIMRERNGTVKAYLEVVCSDAGAGAALVNAVVNVSKSAGVDSVQLAAASVSLIAYYKKFGFARVPDACDAAYMGPGGISRSINSFAYTKGRNPSAAHQYVRSKKGWKGFVDGGASRRTDPVRRHTDGSKDGYLMSRCVAPPKKYSINEYGEVVWLSHLKTLKKGLQNKT
jgi:hypothetical protein